MDKNSAKKLAKLNNSHVDSIIEKYAKLCRPRKITVLSGSDEDLEYIRTLSLKNCEEKPLNISGHTIHFDGYFDQGRDAQNTKILLPKGKMLSKSINTIDRDDGLDEILNLLDGIMEGKEMLVCFFCLGPNESIFSIPALQITDSAYVAHSESILYRKGYDEFVNLNGTDKFFHFIHSAGKLTSNNNSIDVDKRRIYMDLEEERVFTINNQYAGNSVGLKKLALRLAISKANREGWLCEHMFVMGVHPPGKERVTYFTGAFPSACGKTSTAMVPGQSIIGDDISYLRAGEDGLCYAANVEQGIFGIIQDINPIDDPVIHKALTTKRELIMSNILVKNGNPYWLGMGQELPANGENFSGEWSEGKMGHDGKEILPAHKNARYTIRINELENADPNLHNKKGVPVSGIIYGGRDSDTSPPVIESLSWSHGVFIGSALESETTSAKIGQEGVRVHDPMANMDFLVIPLGTYINNHLKFGEILDETPKIFATNYFLKENGKFLNQKVDKKVWLLWMEGRIHNEYDAIETPIGFIPKYDDLQLLFRKTFNRDFSKEDYVKLFSIRTEKLLDRLLRIEKIYADEQDVPIIFHEHLMQQRKRLAEAKEKFKKETITPIDLR
ncbi:MAG: phosphoenolpyruvate carboxykinase (GTP) [archaeon]